MINRLVMVVWILLVLSLQVKPAGARLVVWANNGEDKVTQDELRASSDAESVLNTIWDGSKISIFGAKNEVISFNLILEAPEENSVVSGVSLEKLENINGDAIQWAPASGRDLFSWVDRHIELFYIRYLEIKGLSLLSYDALYDERHVPERFRRPFTGEGEATGAWEDRPDHNKFYPDIAVPLDIVSQFTISAGQNQSIWVDVYIPKSASAGTYSGQVVVTEQSGANQAIPVELTVLDFTLPDLPNARTMLYYEASNINRRYLGDSFIENGTTEHETSLDIIDRHFQLAHRHKISLIDTHMDISLMDEAWTDRLNGNLFAASKGYDGPGVGVGNNVFSIGTYSSWTWSWSEDSEEEMWSNTDAWVNWFDAKNFSTPTDYFLYLIDESEDYATTEQWAAWMDENPGPGSRLMSMATISDPGAWENHVPSLDIPTSGIMEGIRDLWENATLALVRDESKRFYYYNGARPASGSYCIEDDGVALRLNGWIQYKKKIDRWFFWESTYYDNYQGEEGETDVFNQAFTYGSFEGMDLEYHRGESGWNYMNGDGVLFYPGTDRVYPAENYSVPGPFASLRLKHWRRGIQDADYLFMAAQINPTKTGEIVNRMIPKVLWEYGVENPEDPSYVYTDISWSVDPDDWEAARLELAEIIQGTSGADTDGDTDAQAVLSSDLTLAIHSLDVMGTAYDVTLVYYDNPFETGWFWKFGSMEASDSLSSGESALGQDLSITLSPVAAGNLLLDAVLVLYAHPEDTGGWYWKLESFEIR